MAKTFWFAIVLFLIHTPPATRGDGKVFPPIGIAHAETPAQRALIHWEAGTETLVVETSVRSAATNLAWVLPLPSQPTSIRAVDRGLFPTLQTTFQARVILTRMQWWIGGLVLVAVILVLRWHFQRKLPARTLDVLVVLLVLLILSSMLLPALSRAGGSAGASGAPDSTVQLLARTRAGVFDITTLAAGRAEDVVDWLRNNGFAAGDDTLPLLRDYVSHGWVFAAARVSSPDPGELTALDPIAFTFTSPKPIYPMRLTGVGSASLRCDLYVFGPARATTPGWREVYCARPRYETNSTPQTAPWGLRVRHSELATLVRQAPVATKLSAVLAPGDFGSDVAIDWTGFRPLGQFVFTKGAALAMAGSIGSWLLALAVLAGCLHARKAIGKAKWFNRTDRVGFVMSLVIPAVIFACLPTIRWQEVHRMRRWPSFEAREQLRHHALSEVVDLPSVKAILRGDAPESEPHLANARRELALLFQTNQYAGEYAAFNKLTTNIFSQGRLRLEASPGNFTLEASSDGLDLVWHDFDGFPAFRESIPRLDDTIHGESR